MLLNIIGKIGFDLAEDNSVYERGWHFLYRNWLGARG